MRFHVRARGPEESSSEAQDVLLIKGFTARAKTLVLVGSPPLPSSLPALPSLSMGIQGNQSICWLHESTLVRAGASVGLPPSLLCHPTSLSQHVYSAGRHASHRSFVFAQQHVLLNAPWPVSKARVAGSTTGNGATY